MSAAGCGFESRQSVQSPVVQRQHPRLLSGRWRFDSVPGSQIHKHFDKEIDMGKAARNRARNLSDPRAAGGDVAGPGGPAQQDSVVVDIGKAVLLDGSTGVVVHVTRGDDSEDAFGLMLEGRINKTTDRSRVLYLADLEGLASVAAECCSLAGRAGVSLDDFMSAFGEQLEKNHAEYVADNERS